MNDEFYFVDLPGYGFARVSKTMRAGWGEMAEDYLSQRDELKLSIQLIDSRHEPTKLDQQLNEWLVFHEKSHIIVATKSDKLGKQALQKRLAETKKLFAKSKILPVSSSTGAGKDALWTEISSFLKKS